MFVGFGCWCRGESQPRPLPTVVVFRRFTASFLHMWDPAFREPNIFSSSCTCLGRVPCRSRSVASLLVNPKRSTSFAPAHETPSCQPRIVSTHARARQTRQQIKCFSRGATAHDWNGLPERVRRGQEPGGDPPPGRVLPTVRRAVRNAHGQRASRAVRVHQGVLDHMFMLSRTQLSLLGRPTVLASFPLVTGGPGRKARALPYRCDSNHVWAQQSRISFDVTFSCLAVFLSPVAAMKRVGSAAIMAPSLSLFTNLNAAGEVVSVFSLSLFVFDLA